MGIPNHSHSSSSSSLTSSPMKMVFADHLGSLSINNPRTITTSSHFDHFPKFMSYTTGCTSRSSLEDSHIHMITDHDQAKGSHDSSSTSDGFGFRFGENVNLDSSIDLNYNAIGKLETDSCGQSKLCARGHWRPAEDSKLKELVALYGPQNWNLIAEKLEGRSGKQQIHRSILL